MNISHQSPGLDVFITGFFLLIVNMAVTSHPQHTSKCRPRRLCGTGKQKSLPPSLPPTLIPSHVQQIVHPSSFQHLRSSIFFFFFFFQPSVSAHIPHRADQTVNLQKSLRKPLIQTMAVSARRPSCVPRMIPARPSITAPLDIPPHPRPLPSPTLSRCTSSSSSSSTSSDGRNPNKLQTV